MLSTLCNTTIQDVTKRTTSEDNRIQAVCYYERSTSCAFVCKTSKRRSKIFYWLQDMTKNDTSLLSKFKKRQLKKYELKDFRSSRFIKRNTKFQKCKKVSVNLSLIFTLQAALSVGFTLVN